MRSSRGSRLLRTGDRCIPLEDWGALGFFGQVRDGYDDCAEEYDNDVDIRTIIERKLNDSRG
jgi:hypothetical protein